MKTPGGGGYGLEDDSSTADESKQGIENVQRFVERGTVHDYRQSQESA